MLTLIPFRVSFDASTTNIFSFKTDLLKINDIHRHSLKGIVLNFVSFSVSIEETCHLSLQSNSVLQTSKHFM